MRAMIFVAAATLVGALAVSAPPARAQVASTAPSAAAESGWTFAVAPYTWLPTIRTTLGFNTPRNGAATSTISAGVGDYISKVNFALMGGAEARLGRFTIMTDLIYTNTSLTTNDVRLSTFNPGSGPISISRSQQLATGTRMAATIWSLAGGYTLQQGEWGNVDAVVGMRMLVVGNTTNYTLASAIVLPNRTVGLSRTGSLTLSAVNPDAIFGIKGRFDIPNSRFYVPFYVDVGTGSLPFTWQIYTGIAYRVASWIDVSAGYRYMEFESGSSKGVHSLSLGGALIAASLRF
jgi:hypothetical protein